MTPTQVRLALLRCGFVPIPVEGKVPPLKDWQNHIETSEQEIRLWENIWHLAHNTGILTRDVPALDVDILVPEAAEAVEALVRERYEEKGTILVRIGLPPKRAIPFRCATTFAKIAVNLIAPNGSSEQKIEFLASGQQIVVHGDHVTTGKPYAWYGGSPLETKRKELPLIDATDARKLVDDVVALLLRDFGYTPAPERPKPNGEDSGGAEDWQNLIENVRAGRQLHDSLRDLAAKMWVAGMGAGASINLLRAEMQASSAPHDARWQERYDDIPRLVESAEEKIEQPEKPSSLPFLDMTRWDHEPLPQIQWTVPNRIPRRQCCLFSGEGAAGKSTVDLHRSVAHVLGRDWLGAIPERGPALFIDAEDPNDVVHVRLAALCSHYGVKFADLTKGGLHIISLVGEDAVLATANRSGKIMPTPLYQRIIQAVGDIKPISITIASSANVFAGNEIDRSQVQQFISLLTRLAMLANGSLNLISHPSLVGISSDTGLSGNTAWHNAVRARMYLKGMKSESGAGINAGGLRELVFKKNQYGPINETLTLRYQRGLFLPVGDTSFDQVAREVRADEVFLDLLRRFTSENRKVSSSTGKNYAPAVFAQESEAIKSGITSKQLEAAMRRLFADGKIWNEPCGKPSRPAFRLAIKEADNQHPTKDDSDGILPF